MKTMTMKKLALASLTVAFVLAIGAGCARSYQPKAEAPGIIRESVGREEPWLEPPPAEFSRLAVVNGKPFADMYFKNYGVNPTIDTEEENVSTFSVDVDSASYTLARAYLERGHLPEEDAIRVEEFINAFQYDYPDPGAAPFGVQVEAFPSPSRRGYHVLGLLRPI